MAWPEGDLAGFVDFDSIQGEHVIAFFVGGHDDGPVPVWVLDIA